MRPIARLIALSALAITPLLALGCVPQDRYDNLITTNRSLQQQLVDTEAERDEALGRVGSVQDQLTRINANNQRLQSRYDELRMAFDHLETDNDEYLRRIAQLEIGPLPLEVESALVELAASHPDVLTFDAKHGMLRFSSDLTFDLGSVELKTDAAATIQALAGILNDRAAMGLEAHVIGHTDNVRIARPETRRQHPTNMHLSVHRAISVRDALTTAGIDPVRLQVAGYGEFRPVVPNGSRGAAENRRVEIFLAPMPRLAVMPTTAPDQPATTAVDPQTEEPMK